MTAPTTDQRTLATTLQSGNAIEYLAHAGSPQLLVRLAWLGLLWALLLGPILLRSAAPDMTTAFRDPEAVRADVQVADGAAAVITYATQLGTVAVGIGAIAVAIYSRRVNTHSRSLWLAAMALALGPILSAVFGIAPGFTATVLRLPVLFTAAYLLPPVPLNWFVARCKEAIEAFVCASLLGAILFPQWVVDLNYSGGLIPGLNIRLHGAGWHAANLAVLSLVYVILCWVVPARSTKDRIALSAVLLCLILTQSKTIWLMVPVVFGIHFFATRSRWRFLAPYATAVIVVTTAILLSMTQPDWKTSIDSVVEESNVVTLTGRTDVWDYTVRTWSQNPIFGYGPRLWDAAMQREFSEAHYWAPTHSHNQYFQTLGESGIVGVVGLCLFVVVALVYALKLNRSTRGVTVSLFAILLVRGIAEPSFRSTVDETFLVFFVAYVVLLIGSFEATQVSPSLDARPEPLTFSGPPLQRHRPAPG